MATLRQFGTVLSGNRRRNQEFTPEARVAITTTKLFGTPTATLVKHFKASNRNTINQIIDRVQSLAIAITANQRK